jgi:hypothetical protein
MEDDSIDMEDDSIGTGDDSIDMGCPVTVVMNRGRVRPAWPCRADAMDHDKLAKPVPHSAK